MHIMVLLYSPTVLGWIAPVNYRCVLLCYRTISNNRQFPRI